METLGTLRELQATLDYLHTIERELSALPPDLAVLEAQLKDLDKQRTEKTKALGYAKAQILSKTTELALAQRDEDRARAAVKTTSQKVQYTAAIRELDEKERLRASIAKPLKALEDQVIALEAALTIIEAAYTTAKAQFDELHTVFLEEHANQVEGRKMLTSKRTDLEAKLPALEITRFHRLAGTRQGKVVVPVENGACTGCRVKLRGPLLYQLKEAKVMTLCESCQRVLFLP
jgi:hypothetical protein